MQDPREELIPFWLRTALPFGANLGWPALPDPSVSSTGPVPPAVPDGGLFGGMFGDYHKRSSREPTSTNGGILGLFTQPSSDPPSHAAGTMWDRLPIPYAALLAPQPAPQSSNANSGSPFWLQSVSAAPSSPPAPPQSRNAFDPDDLAKSLSIGVAQGAIALPGMFGDARELLAQGAQKAADYIAPGYAPRVGTAVSHGLSLFPPLSGPTSSDIRHTIERVTGPFYQPRTVAGDYLRTVGEFAPGMLAPGGVVRNAGRYVVLPALASETAGQWTQGTWAEPWARFLGALATGGAAAAISHAPRGAREAPSVEQLPRSGAAGEMPSRTGPIPRPADVYTQPEASKSLGNWSAGMHEPPAKPPRPFSADYPSGAPMDASGRLVADIEGRPLTAKYIAGRRVAGGKDEGLMPVEIWDLVEDAIGRPPREYARRTLKGTSGRYQWDYDKQGNRVKREVRINRELDRQQKPLVMAHETGHMVDDLGAGPSGMSIQGLEPELESVYSTLNTGKEGVRPPKLPRDFGYPKREAPSELVAEAVRAYLTNPNYFKTVAPDAAAAIRALVNSHPELSRLIQFNSLGGLTVLGGAMGGAPDDKSDR
jgi:hypothetical protein